MTAEYAKGILTIKVGLKGEEKDVAKKIQVTAKK